MALTKVTSGGIKDGTITNDDIKSDAAITAGKLSATLDLSSKTITLPSASVTAHATNPTKASIEALGIDLPAADLTGTIADARFPSTLPAISGANLTGIDAVVVGTTLPNPVSPEGSLFYKSDTDIFYISNGTQWKLVSNASPATTGGTVTIGALSEGGTFTYDLGTDFTDDVDTDAQLTYTLTSGTMPTGCTLPTTGNSALTGTASGVSSNTNYTWQIKATDTSGGTATQNYQQTINTVVPTVTGGTVTISSVQEGLSASYDVNTNFTFTTGSTFSAYSLLSGSLPSGLSFNTSTGVISGTMGTVSSDTAYSFSIRGTDTNSDYVDQAYSWTITDTPFSATGGTITNISGYRVHTFTSSASGASGFVPNKSGSVDVLVVAGGGGGGSRHGGGGGAGGLRYSTALSISATAYSVTVGGGGAGTPSGQTGSGSTGANSVFSTITSIGGGGGGGRNSNATSGGSGGGGNTGGGSAGASGTSGQGNRGGNTGSHTPDYAGAGGGGAGAVGQSTPSSNTPGAGGVGLEYSQFSSVGGSPAGWFAGGGSGAVYTGTGYALAPNGGGGRSYGANAAGQSGTNNTGGGGAGGTTSSAGGAGGSGIVIIRYAV